MRQRIESTGEYVNVASAERASRTTPPGVSWSVRWRPEQLLSPGQVGVPRACLSCWLPASSAILMLGKATHEGERNMPHIKPERTQRLRIDGMTDTACRNEVEQALRALAGVEGVEVDLGQGLATVVGEVEPEDLINALSSTNYQARPLTENGGL